MKLWARSILMTAFCLGACLHADDTDVLQSLKYGTPEKREQALDLVLAGREPGAGKALVAVLGDAQGAFKLKVMRALGLVREDTAVRPLIELLSDPSPEFRLQAARSLGSIADPAAAAALVKALKDSDLEVREGAAAALGSCGRSGDVAALAPLLKDSNRLVRMAAISSIGHLGSADSLPLLQAQLKDKDTSYKRVVVKAIGSLKGANIDASLMLWLGDKDAYLRGFSAEALAERPANRDLQPALIKLLADPNLGVRIRAIETLGVWKSKAAVPSLLKFLRADEPTLRWKSAQALGEIGDPSAKEALVYVAENDTEVEIKQAATAALKRMKTDQ